MKYPVHRVTIRRTDMRALDEVYISGASTRRQAAEFVRLMYKDRLVSIHKVERTRQEPY